MPVVFGFALVFVLASEEERSINLNRSISSHRPSDRATSPGNPAQADVHDARTLQLRHFITKVFTHTTNLTI